MGSVGMVHRSITSEGTRELQARMPAMKGLMMEFPLTVAAIFRHAERIHPRRTIVTRLADKSLHRYTYGEFAVRARRLATALRRLDVQPGDRVATLAWNNYQHLEAYFGVPMSGAVVHTLNLRLHPDDLAFIANDADDKVAIVDRTLLPLWERVAPKTRVKHVIVFGDPNGPAECGRHEYEALLADAEPMGDEPDPDERTAVAMCYTTGTTGTPKGVVYSHRALVLHAFALSLAGSIAVSEQDT